MTKDIIYPVKNHEFVIANVNSVTARTFKFKVNELLKGKKIKGITMHSPTYTATDPDGNTLVPNTPAVSNGFLTLKTTTGIEIVNKLPNYMLVAGSAVSGTYDKMLPLDDLIIDWEQSYVTLTSGAGLVQNNVFMYSVFYTDDQNCK